MKVGQGTKLTQLLLEHRVKRNEMEVSIACMCKTVTLLKLCSYSAMHINTRVYKNSTRIDMSFSVDTTVTAHTPLCVLHFGKDCEKYNHQRTPLRAKIYPNEEEGESKVSDNDKH